MIHLKVSLMLGGDPYDQARINGIEAFVRDALADGLALAYEHVEVERLACGVEREIDHSHAKGALVFHCVLPSGHEGGHSWSAPVDRP